MSTRSISLRKGKPPQFPDFPWSWKNPPNENEKDILVKKLKKSDEVKSLKAEIEDIKALLKSDQEKKDHEKDADISASGREPEPGLLCTNF